MRPVETDDTLPGGRIVLVADTRERMTAHQCEVIGVGALEVCDDDDCERIHDWDDAVDAYVHRCPVQAGDWLVVRPRSYIDGPTPERREWFVAQRDAWAVLTEN